MTLLRTVDELLRGTHTRPESLQKGEIEVDASRLLTAVLVLGMAYGVFMGLYAVLRGGDGALRQIGAATLKVPLLFVLFLRKALASVFDTRGSAGLNVFRIWIVIYAVVGAQMGWILRPFIGDPNRPFQLFRERHGNFFVAVWDAFWNLF
jgi:hypothetical protein